MRSSKHPVLKAICVSLIFVLAVAAVSAALLLQWAPRYNDAPQRASLAGTVDTLYSGVSSFLYGLVPSVIDETLGTTSYNVSGLSMTFYGRKALLEKELARNPADTVYMEVTAETFVANQDFEGVEGDVYLLPRLDSFRERWDYFRKHISLDDMETAFSLNIFLAGRYWKDILLDHQDIDRVYADNGFVPFVHKNVALSPEKAASSRDKNTLDVDFKEENLRAFRENIEYCQAQGAKVVLVYIPISDQFIWKNSNWDELNENFIELAAETGCDFYNFNLLRNRFSILNDTESFYDEDHMCETGARSFSAAFADVMQKARSGEDVSSLFYASYEEMKQDSPYAAML